MPNSILVTDDDELLRRSLAFNLTRAGYLVQTASTAEEALALVNATPPDLVLLDVGLPGMDGLQALRILERKVPVILVTARRREIDEVLGLELGAQDYVMKPFQFDVLLARIHTVLRRTQQPASLPQSPLVSVGDLTLNLHDYTVRKGDQPLSLAPLEFRLLQTFMEQPGKIFSMDELLEIVWGPEFAGETQIVYVYIHSLREKVEQNPRQPERIVNVRGRGYKYIPQEAAT